VRKQTERTRASAKKRNGGRAKANEALFSAHVERALETVRHYLGARQTEVVRNILRKNLRTDPTSRRLLARARLAR